MVEASEVLEVEDEEISADAEVVSIREVLSDMVYLDMSQTYRERGITSVIIITNAALAGSYQ